RASAAPEGRPWAEARRAPALAPRRGRSPGTCPARGAVPPPASRPRARGRARRASAWLGRAHAWRRRRAGFRKSESARSGRGRLPVEPDEHLRVSLVAAVEPGVGLRRVLDG